MKSLTTLLTTFLRKTGLLEGHLDYHLLRASMVIIFFFFGYQKWWDYETQSLIPFISNGPLISWMYPVFGIRGASWVLGVSEWLFGALIFIGFWNKTVGAFGAVGSCLSFIMTITIIPFMPDGWAASAGGFPAMTGNVPFLRMSIRRRGPSVASYRRARLPHCLKAAGLSKGTPLPRGAQSSAGQIEVGESKHRECASRVLRQAPVSHLGEAPQSLHHVEGMLASGANPRASTVDLSPTLVQWSRRMRAPIDSVAQPSKTSRSPSLQ